MSATRRQVLSVFKTLHRTAQTVFRGDPRAMVMARDKIEADFKKNKSVTKQEEIEELVNFARDCNKVWKGYIQNKGRVPRFILPFAVICTRYFVRMSFRPV